MKNPPSFPLISNLEQIRWAIDENLFMLADRGDHWIVNYLFSSPETFPSVTGETNHDSLEMIRREFRGLTFDKETGSLLRRPLHKFFNLGERSSEEEHLFSLSDQHEIFVKLDGSMICPYRVSGGEVIWGTKMGKTEFSYDVAAFVAKNEKYLKFFEYCERMGISPVFEWMSPKNRVVIDYGDTEQLVLLAARDKFFGSYINLQEFLKKFETESNKIPVVEYFESGKTLDENLKQKIRQLPSNQEGVCIRFKSGHYIKLKGESYCLLHRIKSEIEHERGVVTLILEEKADDLKPLLPKEQVELLEKYETAFTSQFNTLWRFCFNEYQRLKVDLNLSKKEYAMAILNEDQTVKSVLFKAYDKGFDLEQTRNFLKDLVLRQCSKNSKFEEYAKTSVLFSELPKWERIKLTESLE